jgi:8-oxo-dGTP pyrophosphatase MutT (NUDIX family)
MAEASLGSRERPIERPGARVLLLDGRGRLLLFRIEDPSVDLASFWITPGGGLEAGETFEEAARRELFEETGLADFELGPCVWLRPHVWRWGERWIASEEHYYLARVDAHEVNLDGQLEHERSVLAEYRWWSLPELEAAREEVFVPRDLASLLAPLLRGDVPASPIEVGE